MKKNKEKVLEKAYEEGKAVYIVYDFEIVETMINDICLAEDDLTWYETEYGSYIADDIFMSVKEARLYLVKKCKEALEKYDTSKLKGGRK